MNYVVAMVVLQMLDIATTLLGLSMGAEESNPLMAPIVQYPWLMVLVKAAATAFWAMVYKGAMARGMNVTITACIVLVYFMGAVVAGNVAALLLLWMAK